MIFTRCSVLLVANMLSLWCHGCAGLTISADYGSGYNVNCNVLDVSALERLVPPPLSLAKMRMLERDSEETASYMIALYFANMDMHLSELTEKNSPRGDIFTYVFDRQTNLTYMLYLSVIVTAPALCMGNKFCIELYLKIQQDLTPGIPVVLTDQAICADDQFIFKLGDFEIDAFVRTKPIERFSRSFSDSNSRIYVDGQRHYRNFFNSEFSQAPVSALHVEEDVFVRNPSALHPLCKSVVSVQHYGSNTTKNIKWYFETPPKGAYREDSLYCERK